VSLAPRTDAPRTDLDWLRAHFAALYRHDGNERLTSRAEPGQGAPPRFHFGRTALGAIWRFAAELPAHTVRDLARYAALELGRTLDASGPPPPPERLEPMRRVLEAAGGPIEAVWHGPAFRWPGGARRPEALATLADDDEVTTDEVATDEDDRRLGVWAGDLGEPVEALRVALPVAVSCFEGRAVSSCRVARGDPARFAEAGVSTLELARGRGHAPRCLEAWGRAVEALGGHPLYSTTWRDRAGRRVAVKLGLVVYAEDWRFR
jgi:hypothetical protein